MEAQVIGQRPAGRDRLTIPWSGWQRECLHEAGVNAVLTSGSTDANIPLSKGYPAVVLGIITGGSAHTVHEYIYTDAGRTRHGAVSQVCGKSMEIKKWAPLAGAHSGSF